MLVFVFCFFGCGNSDNSDSSVTTESDIITTESSKTTEITTEIKSEQKDEKTEEISKDEATPNDSNDLSQDKNIIKLENDGVSGEAQDKDGMKKDPIITNKSLNRLFTTGDFEITVNGAQVSVISVQDEDVASLLNIEIGQEYVLLGIDITVENTSDKDESINPEMSTITTNTKEQIDSLVLLSDDVGGDYYGNVIKEGQIFFICSKSSIDELNHIKWRIDSPQVDGEHIGDPLIIEFDLIK